MRQVKAAHEDAPIRPATLVSAEKNFRLLCCIVSPRYFQCQRRMVLKRGLQCNLKSTIQAARDSKNPKGQSARMIHHRFTNNLYDSRIAD